MKPAPTSDARGGLRSKSTRCDLITAALAGVVIGLFALFAYALAAVALSRSVA